MLIDGIIADTDQSDARVQCACAANFFDPINVFAFFIKRVIHVFLASDSAAIQTKSGILRRTL